MKMKLLLSTLLLGTGMSAFAYCPNDSFCVYPTPMLDQMSTSIPAAWFPGGMPANSQLCVPTSSTMAFQGLLKYALPGTAIVTNGWLHNTYEAVAGDYQRLVRVAQKMNTDVSKGTYENWTVSTLDEMGKSLVVKIPIPFTGTVDVPVAQVGTKYMAQINFNSMKAIYQTGFTGAVTTHGHYNRVKTYVATPTTSTRTYTYTRNGGHAINPKGHIADYVVYNDPTGPSLRFTKIRTDKTYAASNGGNTVINTLPGGVATASMYAILQSADYFPLLETFNTTTLPNVD